MHSGIWTIVALLNAVLFPSLVECESKADYVGTWTATSNGETCIKMKAEIMLTLAYSKGKIEHEKREVQFYVPKEATSKEGEGSLCNAVVNSTDGRYQINSQVLRLSFSESYVEFYFTMDEAFGTSDTEYVLYAVFIKANYTAMPDTFPDAADEWQLYREVFDPHGEPPDIATVIFADSHYSFYCPSKQFYHIIPEDSSYLPASIQLRKLQLEAYMTTDAFSERETCPADDHDKDLVPIIVGSVLAGLVILTLFAYLIYRCRLPEEIVNLTNPESHFDDVAMYNNKEEFAHESPEEDVEELEVARLHPTANGNSHLVQRKEQLRRQEANDDSGQSPV